MSPLSIDRHAELQREIESAVRRAAADPLDVLRAGWKMLAPERSGYFESAHHSPDAAPREKSMISDEKARPRREAGDGLELESHRRLASTAHSTQGLSVAGHQSARHVLFAACVAVGLCAGRRPSARGSGRRDRTTRPGGAAGETGGSRSRTARCPG